jgi:hypothetical protein
MRFRPKIAGAGTARATLFGGTEDADLLKRYRDMGAARVVVTLRPETADKTLPVLDRWADLIRPVRRAKERTQGVLPRIEAGCSGSTKLATFVSASPSSRRMSTLPFDQVSHIEVTSVGAERDAFGEAAHLGLSDLAHRLSLDLEQERHVEFLVPIEGGFGRAAGAVHVALAFRKTKPPPAGQPRGRQEDKDA